MYKDIAPEDVIRIEQEGKRPEMVTNSIWNEIQQEGKMEYTKGEWQVLPPSQTRPSRAIVCSSAGADIYDAPLTNETLANAHLIAAAPLMYGALQQLLAAEWSHQGDDQPHAFDAAREALAKAEEGL